MGNSEFCPICEKCSVYKDMVSQNQMVSLTYRIIHCLQTNYRYNACKKYQVFVKNRQYGSL
jgi:uncharacterized cysteine cluster protein YcgN (CxxCxxCC family)